MPQTGHVITQTPAQFSDGYVKAELLDHVINANFTFIFPGLRMEETKTSNIVGKYSTPNQ